MKIVFFLEERSAKVMLDEFLPGYLPSGISFQCITFEGKQDLDKQIERRLKGWITDQTAFIILRDQDSSHCITLKQQLLEKAIAAKKPDTIIRIACKELESWYFGDLTAVENALEINGLQKFSKKKTYRIPDAIVNPSIELDKITKGKYQKISGSRAIGKTMSLSANTSHSFKVFLQGIDKAIDLLKSPPSSGTQPISS